VEERGALHEGAWYARSGGKIRELYTIMHLPYTSMVLSYVLIGAAVSPSMHPSRLILTLLAYFLGLGLSAHALNELHARHWGENLTRHELEVLFLVPLIAAVSIGAYGMLILYDASRSLIVPLMLLVFISMETFFLVAYNSDIAKGRFHSTASFAFSWAALPVIISFYVNALTMTLSAVLVASAMAATAGIEITLSRWCKDFRRKNPTVELQFADGPKQNLNAPELIASPEKALKLIVVAVDLLSIGLIVHKLLT
jgi:hypothetical protein